MWAEEIENLQEEERHNQKFGVQYKSAYVKELVENPHVYLVFVYVVIDHMNKDTNTCLWIWLDSNYQMNQYFITYMILVINFRFKFCTTKALPFC